MSVLLFSKKRWNQERAETQKVWTRKKNLWGKAYPDIKKLKQPQNIFYYTI